MYADELQVCSAAKSPRTTENKKEAEPLKSKPPRGGGLVLVQGFFSGGNFCKSDESRLSWAAGVRPRGLANPARRRAEATWRGWQGPAHAGGAEARTAARLSRSRQGRGAPWASVTEAGYAWEIHVQRKKQGSSQRVLQLHRNKKCTYGQRNTPWIFGLHFSAPI